MWRVRVPETPLVVPVAQGCLKVWNSRPWRPWQHEFRSAGLAAIHARNPFRCRNFLTSLRTAPKALLRLVRQRWSIENEWHWARDVQLGEDAHEYRHRIGAPLVSFLRTVVMNLLRLGGFRSIRAGLQEVAHDISRMLSLGGIAPAPASGCLDS